ncbi:MAG: hypothetical protein AAF840_06815, partial [Bacteroidota bacterium]
MEGRLFLDVSGKVQKAMIRIQGVCFNSSKFTVELKLSIMPSRSVVRLGYLLFFLVLVVGLFSRCSSVGWGEAYEKAITQYQNKNWDEALTYFLQVEAQIAAIAPTTLGRLNDPKWDQGQHTYRSIIQIYQNDSNFEQAKTFANKGLTFAILRHGENALPLAEYYHLFGEVFRLSREYDKAMEYCSKALYLLQQNAGLKTAPMDVDSTKAAVLISLGQIAYQNDLGEAATISYYQKSQHLTQQRPDLLPLQVYSLLGQSRFYAERKQFSQAIT